MLKHFFDRMRGTERSPNRRPFAEIIWSWLGSFLGIYLVVFISQLTSFDNLFLVGSFGATAVLIYGAPLADFSQPRNLIGGHIISAIVGVAIYQSVPAGVALTGALAVSISIAAMHLTATMHPPGGATALIAVIGGEKVHILGYSYVLYPIAVGVTIMLFVALIVNNLSKDPKRCYPKYWV